MFVWMLQLMGDSANCGRGGDKLRKPSSVCKLLDILTSTSLDFSTSSAREDWVHAAEKVISFLPVELPNVPDFNGTLQCTLLKILSKLYFALLLIY